ncbi:DUF2490 domain-containing protein [Lacinutrix sp. MedPE-SW]|uniref:DUF2490 domain-containing protein n=1 Tax=Lacinutrix sp. MedPE-SW TaxID=1860087 RepID=UPI0009160A33|nr:DUF2490 domain-containing protein [Lacinutrix sp. MedPE-SW]OIQ19478.1 MAG: hypothetical protein BM549_11090 [Lacinutrix sp. MedPE-SW]
MKHKKHVCLILVLTFVFYTKAQEKQTHYSSWNTINFSKKINNNWFVNTEFNLRRTNFLKSWEQFIVRPFVHYRISSNLDIAFGYSFIKNYNYSTYSIPIDVVENNIFQQLTTKQKFSRFSFIHRFRLEERFIGKVIENDFNSYSLKGNNYKNRFRYKFQILVPIKFNASHKIHVVVYDEVHLDLENGLKPKNLDQNWMFLGVSFNANNHINIKTGYHEIHAYRTNFLINNKIWETTITYNL